MQDKRLRTGVDLVFIFVFAIVLTAFSFFHQAWIGHPHLLADEGYFWYGGWRASLGEIPIRDFEGYDPAHYLWIALWFNILDDNGLVAFRIANTIWQFLGVTVGLVILRRVIHSRVFLFLAGLILLLWLNSLLRALDLALSLAAVYFAALLIESPTLKRHFAAGVFVGLAAFVGRNHGVYCVLAYALLAAFVWFKISRRDLAARFGALSIGVVIGYIPMLLMFALVPGFFVAVVGEVKAMFEYGATNILVDVPWPWRVNYAALPSAPLDTIFRLLLGAMFLAMPIFYLFGIAWVLCKPADAVGRQPIFVASVFVGAMYMHYVFSRPDLPHLVMGMFPLITGVLSMPVRDFRYDKWARPALVMALLTVSIATVGYSDAMASPYLRKHLGFVPVRIGEDAIRVRPDLAQLIEAMQSLNCDVVGLDETVLIAPHWPGFYPILKRKSPTREIYFLFPASPEQQENMISKLKQQKTNWVVLGDVALDGRDDLRFRSTHPLVWKHFATDFQEVAVKGLPENYRLLRRKVTDSNRSLPPDTVDPVEDECRR